MQRKAVLSEQAMQLLERNIPELAGGAFQRAYQLALSSDGKVLEAVNGQLVETSADGTQRVVKKLSLKPAIAQDGIELHIQGAAVLAQTAHGRAYHLICRGVADIHVVAVSAGRENQPALMGHEQSPRQRDFGRRGFNASCRNVLPSA